MSRLDHAPEIVTLAEELAIDGAPVAGILDFCRHRIDRWVADAGGVADISALESLVTRQLQMVFEEVRSDADFDRITDQYARGKKDFVFAAMRTKFDDFESPTYGTLVRRNVGQDAPDRFVAVIDCRGSKSARRFFTKWHEIAHRLTTHADGGATEPAYRSEQHPIERLMDEIAGHVGFYEPIFRLAFQRASRGKPLLTFETVETVRQDSFPEASFQATLFACTRKLPTPVMYLEAFISFKKDVKKRMEDNAPGLFGNEERPEGQLRAAKVMANEAAQEQKFVIPANMRVPEASVIRRQFVGESVAEGMGQEDLSWWESQGRRQDGRAVAVEARRVADRVIAIVQPVEPIQSQPRQPQPKSLFTE